METVFGLYVPENGMIPCPQEMVPVSLLPPFPPDFSPLLPLPLLQGKTSRAGTVNYGLDRVGDFTWSTNFANRR